MAVRLTAAEVAKALRDFIEGTGGKWDWDDFVSVEIADPRLDRIRREADSIPLPPENLDGLQDLLRQAETIAADDAAHNSKPS